MLAITTAGGELSTVHKFTHFNILIDHAITNTMRFCIWKVCVVFGRHTDHGASGIKDQNSGLLLDSVTSTHMWMSSGCMEYMTERGHTLLLQSLQQHSCMFNLGQKIE